jgi:peptide/nickel transport system substrate-binding protein
VIEFSANENYRDPAKPAFATVTFKGGGDADGGGALGDGDRRVRLRLEPAARARVLAEMEAGGKGTS